MKTIGPDLWNVDTRQPDSPYQSVFFHDSHVPAAVDPAELPSRNLIFEFELAPAEGRESGMQAMNMQLISPRR